MYLEVTHLGSYKETDKAPSPSILHVKTKVISSVAYKHAAATLHTAVAKKWAMEDNDYNYKEEEVNELKDIYRPSIGTSRPKNFGQ